MFNILCFGDSNTFGTNPPDGRHPRDVRWTGRLQTLLGEDYYIIEEGLGGRTTVFEDPLGPGRCGIQFLPVALLSHRPLDLVILCLGTNDCKSHICASETVIARGMEMLCQMVKTFDYGAHGSTPEVLVVSPVHVREEVEKCPYAGFDMAAVEKSKKLAPLYRKVAESWGCKFFDAASVAQASPIDQVHMEAEEHRKLGDALAAFIKENYR